ncbi:MAG: hypothetical protein AB8B65_04705 [Kordia sp.]|uniref:hypothetical protein n=1 Tax=Kordia sp. TaxID=1965332 RepID=UPI0038595250
MKKIILSFIVFATLFSCSKKEQYYGIWRLNGFSLSNPNYLKIDADSIYLSELGNYWTSYPVKIKNNYIRFAGQTYPTSIFKDSLIFNHNLYWKDTIYSPLDIKLPNIKSESTVEIDPDANIYYMSYGKKPNTDEYAFLLNDKYGSFSDIKHFMSSYSCGGGEYDPPHTLFICDKNTSTRDLEKFFLELFRVNTRTLYTVNSTDYKTYTDSIKSISSQQKQILSYIFNPNYDQKINGDVFQPTMLRDFSIYPTKDLQPEKIVFAFLIQNEFYYQKENCSSDVFSAKIQQAVSQHKTLITLFDLKSDYKHYLEFNDIVNSKYLKIYDSITKQNYNTTYKQLDKEKKVIVRRLYTKKVIQNISIPHFLSFEETPIENFNFPFKNVKQQLPEIYFEGLK